VDPVFRAVLAASLLVAGCTALPEHARYVRVLAKGTAPECEFTLRSGRDGWSIESVTNPARPAMTVTSRFDSADRLLEARAATGDGREVRVKAGYGMARIERLGRETQDVDAPKGVIVTSAPDWTDTFLISRRYDRTKGGRQEFPGLWIHPVQAIQRLTFTAEAQGTETLEHDGERLELVRLSIRLRGNSPYLAWADSRGRMIKLVSLPFGEGAIQLVLEGFEPCADALNPKVVR